MNPLRKLRQMRALSQRDLSDATGIEQATISKIENSERSRSDPGKQGATAEHAAILARYFGHAITESEILYPADYQQPAEREVQANG